MTSTLETIKQSIHDGELDNARTAITQAEQAGESAAEVSFLRGCVREAELDTQGALDDYSAALTADPEHMPATFRSARLRDRFGDDEEAVKLYEKCIQKERAPVAALVNLSVLYEQEGRLADAERCLRSVLAEYPTHGRAKRFLKSVTSGYTMYYDEGSQREREQHDAILDVPVTDFELSVRARNCLRQMNIRTLGDLLSTTEAELLSYKNFGETSLNEIKAMLAQKSLGLGQTIAPVDTPDVSTAPLAPQPEVGSLGTKSVAELELSVRSRKCLQRLGVATIGELAAHSEDELMASKNFGQTSLVEIKRQLATFGLSLRSNTVVPSGLITPPSNLVPPPSNLVPPPSSLVPPPAL